LLHSARAAVSTYLEVFILIGLAIGGSGIVFEAGLNDTASARGPAVSMSDATIRQGEHVSIESAAIYNTGGAPFSSFVMTTGGVSAAASYCYTLYDPQDGTTLLTTCPGLAADPASVEVVTDLSPGRGVVVELTITGAPFSLGAVTVVTITTSSGAQQSMDVEVLPA
jgi:hypothetical protein